MSNYKQSSVEWLVEKLFPKNDNIRFFCPTEILEQAKAMHKDEHGQTWDKSLDNLKARGMNEMRAYTDFDQYYNETFGE